MAIQDSDSERRNLMVCSLAFIVFFYAGGDFANNEVHLQVINAKFSNPMVLGFIAWILLFWFLYRYWQTHSSSFADGFSSEIISYYSKPYFEKYVSKKIGYPLLGGDGEGYYIECIKREHGKFSIKYGFASKVERDKNTGKITSWTNLRDDLHGEVFLDDFIGWLLRLRAYIECCFRFPSFANYIVPYIVFVVALFGPVYRWWL